MAFSKPFESLRVLPKNILSIRANGMVFIPEPILQNVFGLNQKQAKYYQLFIDDEKAYIIGIKIIPTLDVKNSSIRKSAIEKYGVSVNIEQILKFLCISKPKKRICVDYTNECGIISIDLTNMAKAGG